MTGARRPPWRVGDEIDPTLPTWMKNGTPVTDLVWVTHKERSFWVGEAQGRPWIWWDKAGHRLEDEFSLTHIYPVSAVNRAEHNAALRLWRIVPNDLHNGFAIYEEDSSVHVGWFAEKADADRVVAEHNAIGAKPLALAPGEELWVMKRDVTGHGHGVRRLDAAPVAARGAEPVLDSIALALESRGYANCCNGKSIGELLDELEQLRAAPVAARPEPAGEVEWLTPITEMDRFASVARGCGVNLPYSVTSMPLSMALDLENARAALARRPAEGWRDIASAPQQGWVDLWHRGGWRIPDAERLSVSGALMWADAGGKRVPDEDVLYWIPLPAPPRDEGGER